MRSLYDSILEAIQDSDERVEGNTLRAAQSIVHDALEAADPKHKYACCILNGKVNVLYARNSKPAVYEAITYDTSDETLRVGGKGAPGHVPLQIFDQVCTFTNCCIRVITKSVVATDFAKHCNKCMLFVTPVLSDSDKHKYLEMIAEGQKLSMYNEIVIDPIFDMTVSKDSSFLNGISFKGFTKVHLGFNADVNTIEGVEAKTFVAGTWSIIHDWDNPVQQINLQDYGQQDDETEKVHTVWLDKFIKNNKFHAFGVVTNSVQYTMYFQWDSKNQVYDRIWKANDEKRVPPLKR